MASCRIEQALDAVLVRDPGAVYPGFDQQPFGVHQDVALAASALVLPYKVFLLRPSAV